MRIEPTARQLQRLANAALDNVDKEVAAANRTGFSRGLAVEGYAGGYAQAMRDIVLAANGTRPDSRYWPSWERHHELLRRRKKP